MGNRYFRNGLDMGSQFRSVKTERFWGYIRSNVQFKGKHLIL